MKHTPAQHKRSTEHVGHTDNLGGRLPLADPASLTDTQRKLLDRMMTTVVPWADNTGFQISTADGRLIGPLNPGLLYPAFGAQFLQLQFAEQQHTSLSERVRQVVILTVGAVWRADYELYSHSAAAPGRPHRRRHRHPHQR